MSKKIILVVSIILLAGIVLCAILVSNVFDNETPTSNEQKNTNNNDYKIEENDGNNSNADIEENHNSDISNSVVIYFSATGTTQKVAENIKDITNSDIIEIIPKEEYTSEDLSYTNNNCRANREQNDSNARPEIKNSINVDDYNVIYLGFPIWWGDVPKIIQTFMESYDLKGKTIIPFCTSGSSGISQSMNTLKTYSGINFINGKRFSSSTTKSEIESWIDSLK